MITNKRLAEIKARHDASRLGEWGDLTAFLAHAHQDVPALVAEVERLREALGKVEQTANHGVNHPNEALALCHQFAAAALAEGGDPT